MKKLSLLPAILVLASGITAQTYLYHPSNADKVESGANTIPFGSIISAPRYQSLHSALGGGGHVLKAISLRRGPNANAWTGTTNKGGTANIALTMAYTSVLKASSTWSLNLVSNVTQVIKTKNVSLPDTQAAPAANQVAPFNITFPFDSTWAYIGTNDVVWDMTLNQVPNQVYFVDARNFTQGAATTNYGTACTAQNQTRSMLQQVFIRNRPWYNDLEWSARIFYGPSGANAGIGLGLQRTAVTVGNWCTQVYTNPIRYWFGKCDSTANGVFNVPGAPNYWTVEKWDKSYANLTLYAQGFAADNTARNGIVLTQGVQVTIPPISTSTEVGARIYGATTGSVEIGYSLATRFDKK